MAQTQADILNSERLHRLGSMIEQITENQKLLGRQMEEVQREFEVFKLVYNATQS